MDVYQDDLFAELYDQVENHHDDLRFLAQLIQQQFREARLRIFELCCGTGRILIPLARTGHELVGLDSGAAMLRRAQMKIAQLPGEVQERISVNQRNSENEDWGSGYDVVVLGGNVLYEFNSERQQEFCIAQAGKALKPGGLVYLDNLQKRTTDFRVGLEKNRSIYGTGDNGTYGEAGSKVVRIEHPEQMLYYERYWMTKAADGEQHTTVFASSRRLPYPGEIRGWLARHGFTIVGEFSSRAGMPWSPGGERAIFWAQRN